MLVSIIAIGQGLSEVKVIVWPDGVEVADAVSINKRAHVFRLRYHTVGITIVTIAITVLDITALKIYVVNTR